MAHITLNDFTTIQITKDTRQLLKNILRKSETYEDGLCRIIKEWSDKN